MEALLTIHDVMPETLERVHRQLIWLKERGVPPATLLVVPGRDWTISQLNDLRSLADSGFNLAAHGWQHETTPRRCLHRIHAALISRRVAEHLALDASGIEALLERAYRWFTEQGLPQPTLYVPPAWALGRIRRRRLAATPYDWIETTSGLYSIGDAPPASGASRRVRFRRFPLTGYDADTAWRVAFLSRWNAWQIGQARRARLPLRISLHPNDLELGLAEQLETQLSEVDAFIGVDELSRYF